MGFAERNADRAATLKGGHDRRCMGESGAARAHRFHGSKSSNRKNDSFGHALKGGRGTAERSSTHGRTCDLRGPFGGTNSEQSSAGIRVGRRGHGLRWFKTESGRRREWCEPSTMCAANRAVARIPFRSPRGFGSKRLAAAQDTEAGSFLSRLSLHTRADMSESFWSGKLGA